MTFTCTSAAGPEHAIFSTRKLLFVCVCVFFCLKPHHSLTLATMHYSSLSYEVRYTHPSLFSRFLMEDPLVQCCDAPWRYPVMTSSTSGSSEDPTTGHSI